MKKTLDEMIREGRELRNINLTIDDGENARKLRRSQMVERCKNKEEKEKLFKTHIVKDLVERLVKAKRYKDAVSILDSLETIFDLVSQRHLVIHSALKKKGSIALFADKNGWTFAHEISRRFLFTPAVLPEQIFDVADKEGTTVRDVLTMAGFWIHDAEEEKKIRNQLRTEHFLRWRSMGSYATGLGDFLLLKSGIIGEYFGVESNGEIEKILAERAERQNKKSFLSRIFLFR